MSTEEEIEAIINQLQELRIRQTSLLRQQSTLLNNLEHLNARRSQEDANAAPGSGVTYNNVEDEETEEAEHPAYSWNYSRTPEVRRPTQQQPTANFAQAATTAPTDRRHTREPAATHNAQAATQRPFELNDRVVIINPKANQESEGRVTRAGRSEIPSNVRISVLTASGRTIIRAPFNLRHAA